MKAFLTAVFITMLLMGCASRKVSPLDSYAGVDKAATIAQGALVGAAAGATISGVISWLSGGDDDDIKKAAAVGAGAGAVGGAVYGVHVANEKEKIYKERKSIAVQLREIKKENKRLDTKTQEVGKRIAVLKKKIAEHKAKGEKSQLENDRLKNELSAINLELAILDKEYMVQMSNLRQCAEEEHKPDGGTRATLLASDLDYQRILSQRKQNHKEAEGLEIK